MLKIETGISCPYVHVVSYKAILLYADGQNEIEFKKKKRNVDE